jgi:hypothetical protein
MPDNNNNSGHQDTELVELIHDLARRFRMLKDRIARADLLLDAIDQDLATLIESIEAAARAHPDIDYIVESRRSRGRARQSLMQTSKSGVSLLVIIPRPDGLSDVQIDSGKEFTLPPLLADVLTILAMDSDCIDDGLVGWKTLDEVAILLEKKAGRRFNKHSVTQTVYRLRKELFSRGGINPYLVQSNRRQGVRFALRRKLMPVIEGD